MEENISYQKITIILKKYIENIINGIITKFIINEIIPKEYFLPIISNIYFDLLVNLNNFFNRFGYF